MKNQADPLKKSKTQALGVAPLVGAFSLPQLFSFPTVLLLVLVPLIIVEVGLVIFYLAKINKKHQPPPPIALEEAPTPAKPVPPPKPPMILISKAEIADNKLKFSIKQGLLRKKWVTLKEIPLTDLFLLESLGNTLTVTTKDAAFMFVYPKKNESFSKFQTEVAEALEAQHKARLAQEQEARRRSDLNGLIHASTRIVDVSFDILMGLQQKRVNWPLLEGYVNRLGGTPSFWGPTVPPLSLDFSAVDAAVKRRVPQEASDETFAMLKLVYSYFEALKKEETSQLHPNFKDAHAVVAAYYTLNDMLFAKVVGAKENQNETSALKSNLDTLAAETAFQVDFEALTKSVSQIGSLDVDVGDTVEDTRDLFKMQLKRFDTPIEIPPVTPEGTEPSSPEATPPTETPEVPASPEPPSQTPPQTPSEVSPEPTPTVETPPQPLSPENPQATSLESAPEAAPPLETPTSTTSALDVEPPVAPEPLAEPSAEAVPEVVEVPAVEQAEPAKPESAEQAPSSVVEPEAEAPAETPEAPKKPSFGRRLRKAIMGY
ncbi:MAG: hypothetical protein NWE92_11255 [Candidatus Bathyarchaeota archaeon]|nr:hypothetical protein [Candidatus Bathyarchaeota archaeon]